MAPKRSAKSDESPIPNKVMGVETDKPSEGGSNEGNLPKAVSQPESSAAAIEQHTETQLPDAQEFIFSESDEDLQFVSRATVQQVIELRGDRLTRQDLMRNRMFNETMFYLNNSNSKFVIVGVTPTSLGMVGPVVRFSAEIKIAGEKCMPFSIGTINDFFHLMREIRSSKWFRNHSEETRSLYGDGSKGNRFSFTREDNHGQPIYKISKLGTQLSIKLGYVSIEGLLRAELSIAKCYALKSPNKYFNAYIDAMNAKIKNRMINLYDDTKFFPPSFIEEALTNFESLFKYDLEQVLGTRDIELFPTE